MFPQYSHADDPATARALASDRVTCPAATLDASTATDALEAVLEALSIPYAATVGDDEVRAKILDQRIGHAVVMLKSILHDEHPAPNPAWSIDYLRERLAEHPAVGYRTWDERMAELEAAKTQDGGR